MEGIMGSLLSLVLTLVMLFFVYKIILRADKRIRAGPIFVAIATLILIGGIILDIIRYPEGSLVLYSPYVITAYLLFLTMGLWYVQRGICRAYNNKGKKR